MLHAHFIRLNVPTIFILLLAALCLYRNSPTGIQNYIEVSSTSPHISSEQSDDVASFHKFLDSFHSQEWKQVSISKGIVTYEKSIPGTKLLAFKGIVEIDMHISDVVGLFADTNRAKEWVDMLQSMTIYPNLFDKQFTCPTYKRKVHKDHVMSGSADTTDSDETSDGTPEVKGHRGIVSMIQSLARKLGRKNNKVADQVKKLAVDEVLGSQLPSGIKSITSDSTGVTATDTDVIHQTFNIPWPLIDRESLLLRNWCYDSDKSVTVYYSSIDDIRVPETPTFVRAISPYCMWRFQDSTHVSTDLARVLVKARGNGVAQKDSRCSNGKSRCTVVEIECLVDSKTYVPAWIINYVQKQWPQTTLRSFEALLKEKLSKPLERIKNW